MSAALLAVQNADVLRSLSGPELGEPGPDLTVKSFARELGRDDSNLGKSLSKLRGEGLIEPDRLVLTAAGQEMQRRLDVLDGRNVLPPGFSALLHCELAPHPLNPRKSFDTEVLDELRQDILQSGGLTSSLLVRPAHAGERDEEGGPNFWIVAGERRWRAIAMAIEEGDLPADYRLPCQIRTMSDAEHLRLSIGENIQRVDLDHVELGRQFEALILTGEDTPRSIGERISKTPEYVQQHVRILRLSGDELDQLKRGEMTFKAALDLVAKPRPKAEAPPMLDFAEDGSGRAHPSNHAEGSDHDSQGSGSAAGNGAEPQHSPAPSAAREAPLAGAPPPPSYAAASGRGAEPAQPAPALQEPPRAEFSPSAKMKLVLLEVAAKVSRDPLARFREGYTAVDEVPAGGAAPELVRARAIGFRSIGGKDEVRIDPRGPGRVWLDQVGFDRDDEVGRRGRCGDAAIDVGVSGEAARPAYSGTGYVTAWLNTPEASPHAPVATPPPPTPAMPGGAMLGDSLIGIDDEDNGDLQDCRQLAQAWTGTGYRFPPASPSLPKEEDFRALLTRLGVELPLQLDLKDGAEGAILDASGKQFITADYSGDLLSEEAAQALAELVRIAIHVCAGEATVKAAN